MIELVITLAVFAILVALGTPAIQDTIRNGRVAAQHNELIAFLSFAKSEAVRRNTSVPINLTSTANGWDAIVEDPSDEADVEGCVPGQLRCTSNTRVALIADVAVLDFNSRGYIRDADEAWTAETLFLQHENCEGNLQRRRIDILPTGQISSCSLACNSMAACPP